MIKTAQERLKRLGAYVITSGDHLAVAQKACRAGANIVQYRDKTSSRRQLLANAGEIREMTRRCNTIFIVNDFIDVALIVGADGVHLGQDDIPIRQARRITPKGFIIGVSTHSLAQAAAAEQQGADYIGIGPVFATPTKESYPPIGIDTVRQVQETAHIPFVAIGGLTPQNIAPLRQMGVCNFAMVRAFRQDTETVIGEINRYLKKY
jgi:thiamine-phosphate pyrophosphorylase